MMTRQGLATFIREWFLPLAMALGVGIYILFHNVSWCGALAEWYAPHNNDVLPFCMFLVLFTTFCKVNFRKIRPVTWHLWVTTIQVAAVVGLVIAINTTHLSGRALILIEALLVCVICPCGSAAAVITAKLGGSLEETTTYTFLSNILSAFLISLFFPLLPRYGSGELLSFGRLFLTILWRVSIVLMFPMLVAFLVRHLLPRLHHTIVSVPDMSFYLWGISLIIVSATTAKNINDALSTIPLHFLLTIAAGSLALCLGQFAVGRGIGRHMGKAVDCGQALGQKNTIISIWVTTLYLHPLASVGPGCYILWQNLVNAIEIYLDEHSASRGKGRG